MVARLKMKFPQNYPALLKECPEVSESSRWPKPRDAG